MMQGSSRNRVVVIEPTLVLEWNSQFQARVGNAERAHGGVTCGALRKEYVCVRSARGDFSAELLVFKGNSL